MRGGGKETITPRYRSTHIHACYRSRNNRTIVLLTEVGTYICIHLLGLSGCVCPSLQFCCVSSRLFSIAKKKKKKKEEKNGRNVTIVRNYRQVSERRQKIQISWLLCTHVRYVCACEEIIVVFFNVGIYGHIRNDCDMHDMVNKMNE